MIPTTVLRAARQGFNLGRGHVRVLSTRFGKVCLAHRDLNGVRMQVRLALEKADTASRLHAEMSWLKHLHDMHHLTVPFPRRWRNDGAVSPQLMARDGSVWRSVVCSWIPGHHLNLGLDARAMERAGALLAHLHAANVDAPLEIAAARPVWWIPRLFELATTLRDLVQGSIAAPADMSPQLVNDLRAAHDALVLAESQLPHGQQVEGLIHTDAHWQNLRFMRERVGIVDFEDFAAGRFMLDVACLWGKVESRRNARQLLDAALDGYSRVTPLPNGYLRDLHVMLAFRRFDYAGWVLSWPRTDLYPWGPDLLRGLRRYVDGHLAR